MKEYDKRNIELSYFISTCSSLNNKQPRIDIFFVITIGV